MYLRKSGHIVTLIQREGQGYKLHLTPDSRIFVILLEVLPVLSSFNKVLQISLMVLTSYESQPGHPLFESDSKANGKVVQRRESISKISKSAERQCISMKLDSIIQSAWTPCCSNLTRRVMKKLFRGRRIDQDRQGIERKGSLTEFNDLIYIKLGIVDLIGCWADDCAFVPEQVDEFMSSLGYR
ncbi:hypothetical protein BDR04DRAFT_1143470 [Suillus decipiens]|nr:hypothetical protein BDR04DRAFT_1143470 [Suillus decipiens]